MFLWGMKTTCGIEPKGLSCQTLQYQDHATAGLIPMVLVLKPPYQAYPSFEIRNVNKKPNVLVFPRFPKKCFRSIGSSRHMHAVSDRTAGGDRQNDVTGNGRKPSA
jgi:hypothetical protein